MEFNKVMSKNKKKYLILILYLICFLVFYNFPFQEVFKWKWLPRDIQEVKAAEVTIDSNINTDNNSSQRAPNVVFLANNTGYSFGRDSDGTCVYWKTIDVGKTWGSAVQLTAQTDCLGTTVWYDRWTPGDTTGNYIHIVFGDSGGDDLWYERLYTTDDTQLGEVSAVSNSAQGGSLNSSNSISITKATDGDLYVGTSDASDSYVVRCTTTCGTATNWAETASNPMDAAEDELILRPLASGNIMLVNWDISASTNSIRSKVYTDSGSPAWDVSWTNIGNAVDATTYKHAFDITLNTSNNNLYLCYSSNVGGDGSDIYTKTYNGSSWSENTSIGGLINQYYQCAISYDNNTNEIYVAYVREASLHVYQIEIIKSTDYMSTWNNTELISGSSNTEVSISLNTIATNISYAIWKNTDTEDLMGNFVNSYIDQTNYIWQNDDAAPNSNTNMASISTSISNVKKGQRLTARFQLTNSGYAFSSLYGLQFSTDLSNWTNVGPWTAISYATGTSSNGTAITSQVCGAPTGYTWVNGTWHEATSTNTLLNIGRLYYSEISFMIHTANAAENTTYYLRLYKKLYNVSLNNYSNYPTLTLVDSTNNTILYSWGSKTTANPGGSQALDFYFDDLEYTRSSSSNNIYATSSLGNVSRFNFTTLNDDSTDNITPSWEGNTTYDCSSYSFVLEVYDFTIPGWQSKATNTTCTANTDFTISTTISSNVSKYYSSNWTYWRVYQKSTTAFPKTDYYYVTFSAGGLLSLSAPSTITFSSYALGGSGVSQYTFATGTEQIIAADSGIGSGWTLSGVSTDWTTGSRTIPNGLFYFRSDGATNTEPSLIFSNNSYTGIAEGTNNQNFNGSVTLMTASNGNGIGTYYFQPTFDLYINSTSTYAGSYTATVTLTLAYQSYFESLKPMPRASPSPALNYKMANNQPNEYANNNLSIDFRRLAIKTKVIA